MTKLPGNLTPRTRPSSIAAPVLPGYSGAVEQRTISAMVLVVGVTAAVATQRPAIAPLIAVGAIFTAAGAIDARTRRIPNALTGLAALVIIVSVGPVAVIEREPITAVVHDVVAGVLLSGAPVLFMVWFVAPRLMGGGDWKLLAVGGAAIGMMAPSATALIGLVAVVGAAVGAGVTRRRELPLGPYLAAGYAVAGAAAITMPDWLGAVR